MKECGIYMGEKRLLGLVAAGFLLGRVWLFEINPFAVAFFAAMCTGKRGRKGLAIAIMAGMMSSAGGIALLKYMVLFSVILGVEYFQEKINRGRVTPLLLSALCGGLNLLLGAAVSMLSVNTWEMFWLSVLEGLAVLALAGVYQWGIHFILYPEWDRLPGNEELVSLLVLVFTVLYGIPRGMDDIFSITGTISYFIVLATGYRYGAATGAMAGAAGGILAVLCGNSMVMVGIYCMLGISVGTFRRLGRIGGTAAFFAMACIFAYAARDEIAGILELRAVVSAGIVFLAIPGRLLRMVEPDDGEERENPFAREDVRVLANDRIEDFASAFHRLSRSFRQDREWQKEVSEEEVERIFMELSQRICSDCTNCKFCWDKHYEETSANIHNILLQAGREGNVAISGLTPEFGRRCIRLASYVEYAEERMAVAKMNLGWRNRMAENREIMARQMMEVAEALKSFTMDLEEAEEIPAEGKRAIGEELKKEGVRMKKLAAKRRKGHLEVVFNGRCQGNQCLTKTDLANAIERAAGVRMCPDRETRNVLSGEEETMFFREETQYKALTGLARVAKSGETVSGDSYSFLELQSGELLMVLADGMGSGEKACRDSASLIETLEHLMEAGFEKKSALRLLNTLFVANYEGSSFTTLDMVSVNLYTGICEILKNGAAATFIRHGDEIETIYSKALPVGVDMEAESDLAVTELRDGDMVVMVSDGVIDGFCQPWMAAVDGEDTIQRLIEGLACQNPNDMANQILMHALARSSREATDDMSVLVAGIWKRHH